MAFTAGSVELARAQKLANQLADYSAQFGNTQFSGTTAAIVIEKLAKKMGFGITGITTGAGFPPFGSFYPSLAIPVAAALQNPRGETMASGVAIGAIAGRTVGIFMPKYVRDGSDYFATMFAGVTLALGYTSGSGNTFSARGPVSISTNDFVVFSDATYTVVSGATSATTGGTAAFRVGGVVASTYATGAAFSVTTIGVTRGTSGIAGATRENFVSGSVKHAGYTATLYFNGVSGASFGSPGYTWGVL